MDRDEVEVHKLAKKRTRPISSHFDQTNLVNKGFIIWLLVKFCSRDTAGSPERARWLHLARSGSQSQRAIWFILPAHGASHIIKKIINLYIIAAQNNKDCVCFLYKQEPENIKSQLPVFITDEHGLKEIKVLLCTNTMGSSSHNKTLSCNAVTKGFSRPTSHPVQGWMGNNKAFCSHGTRDGRRVIKVYSIKW